MFLKLFINVFILTYGLILPIYWSHKALEENNVEDLKKWLSHWLIYLLFTQALYVPNLIFGSWLPFYDIIVLTTFLWMINPQFNGGRYLYENHLKIFLSKHESTIDSYMQSVRKNVLKFTIKACLELAEHLKDGLLWILKKYSRQFSEACSHITDILDKEKLSRKVSSEDLNENVVGNKMELRLGRLNPKIGKLMDEVENCLGIKEDSSSKENLTIKEEFVMVDQDYSVNKEDTTSKQSEKNLQDIEDTSSQGTLPIRDELIVEDQIGSVHKEDSLSKQSEKNLHAKEGSSSKQSGNNLQDKEDMSKQPEKNLHNKKDSSSKQFEKNLQYKEDSSLKQSEENVVFEEPSLAKKKSKKGSNLKIFNPQRESRMKSDARLVKNSDYLRGMGDNVCVASLKPKKKRVKTVTK